MGDNPVERQLARLRQTHDTRYIHVRNTITPVGTCKNLVEVNGERVESHLLSGHADQNTGPISMRDVVCQLDEFFYSGGFARSEEPVQERGR